MVHCMKEFGGRISWRSTDDGQDKPYEMNITLFDALQGTLNGPDKWQIPRFMCAHGVMLALEGVPAIYIHSLVATQNYYQGVEHTNHNRTINRYKWDEEDLEDQLSNGSHHQVVFESMKKLIEIRKDQSCFHPNAEQFVLHISDEVFGFWRHNIGRTEMIFCLFNVTCEEQTLSLTSLNLPSDRPWTDLVANRVYEDLYGDLVLAPYQFVWLKSTVS